MSGVPKSRQSKSKREFDKLYNDVYRDVIDMVESHFHTSDEVYELHKTVMDSQLHDALISVNEIRHNIRKANSIFPDTREEYIKRRLLMTDAIAYCFNLLQVYESSLHYYHPKDEKYGNVIDRLYRLKNSIRKWRESDNRFKRKFEAPQEIKTACEIDAVKPVSVEQNAFQTANADTRVSSNPLEKTECPAKGIASVVNGEGSAKNDLKTIFVSNIKCIDLLSADLNLIQEKLDQIDLDKLSAELETMLNETSDLSQADRAAWYSRTYLPLYRIINQLKEAKTK